MTPPVRSPDRIGLDRRAFGRSLAAAATIGAAPQTAKAQNVAPFKLSVMLWTIEPNRSIERRFDVIANSGYQFVELSSEHRQWSRAEFGRVASIMGRLGLSFDAMAGVRTGFADPQQSDAFLADLTAMIGTANQLECPSIIVLSGKTIPELGPGVQHQASIDTLSRAADLAEKARVHLLVECLDPEEDPSHYLNRASEGFEIVRKVGHPNLTFLYDIYHEQISEGNLIEKLKRNVDVTGAIHIADVPGRHEPGTGEINYSSIFADLRALKFGGTVAMEFLPLSDATRALRSARLMACCGD